MMMSMKKRMNIITNRNLRPPKQRAIRRVRGQESVPRYMENGIRRVTSRQK
jgi:hypothetical protein